MSGLYDDLIGLPFEWPEQGTDKGFGPDSYFCYGLACELYKRHGRMLPRKTSANDPQAMALAIELGKEDYREIQKPEFLCLASFRVLSKYPTHIGVVLADCMRMIHILPKRRVCIEPLRRWLPRLDGYFRYVGDI